MKVWLNTFIPMDRVNNPGGRGCFTGDSRDFSSEIHASSRTHQEIEFDSTSLATTIDWKHIGTSHQVDCDTGELLDTATASEGEITNSSPTREDDGRTVRVHFTGAASNPLKLGAPAIDFDASFHIDPARRHCTFSCDHDGFPAYEAYVTADGGAGRKVYGYDPRDAGETPFALFPPMDKTGHGAVDF